MILFLIFFYRKRSKRIWNIISSYCFAFRLEVNFFNCIFLHYRLNLELRDNEGRVPLWLALSRDTRVDPMDEDSLPAKLVKHGASPDAVNNITGDMVALVVVTFVVVVVVVCSFCWHWRHTCLIHPKWIVIGFDDLTPFAWSPSTKTRKTWKLGVWRLQVEICHFCQCSAFRHTCVLYKTT